MMRGSQRLVLPLVSRLREGATEALHVAQSLRSGGGCTRLRHTAPVEPECSTREPSTWEPANNNPPSTSGRSMGNEQRRAEGAWKMTATQVPALSEAEMMEGTGPRAIYERRCASGLYRRDPRQAVTIDRLQELYDKLQVASGNKPALRRRPSGLTMVDTVERRHDSAPALGARQHRGGPKASWWSNLIGSREPADTSVVPNSRVQGLYMHGGVGCGKTMLMDVFVASAPPELKVVREHFHAFMLDVHSKLKLYHDQPDPLMRVAYSIAQDVRVLCMDEFFVTDVADAMILNRLFSRLWQLGLVLVATSNRAPDALYENGLQRVLFLPFIERLKAACITHDMASPVDYRRLAQHQRGLYFVLGEGLGDTELKARCVELARGVPVAPAVVDVIMGRQLHVPAAACTMCMFSFEELCGRPLGAADYGALVGKYHTLCLSGIPRFTGATRAEAYRFTTLIDVLYEHRIRLLASAETTPFKLFDGVMTLAEAAKEGTSAADAVVDDNLGFSKDRTISRLTEMQSIEYLLTHAQQHAPDLLLALQEQQAKMSKAAAAAAASAV